MHFPAARNAGRRCKGKGTDNFWGLQKKFLQRVWCWKECLLG